MEYDFTCKKCGCNVKVKVTGQDNYFCCNCLKMVE